VSAWLIIALVCSQVCWANIQQEIAICGWLCVRHQEETKFTVMDPAKCFIRNAATHIIQNTPVLNSCDHQSASTIVVPIMEHISDDIISDIRWVHDSRRLESLNRRTQIWNLEEFLMQYDSVKEGLVSMANISKIESGMNLVMRRLPPYIPCMYSSNDFTGVVQARVYPTRDWRYPSAIGSYQGTMSVVGTSLSDNESERYADQTKQTEDCPYDCNPVEAAGGPQLSRPQVAFSSLVMFLGVMYFANRGLERCPFGAQYIGCWVGAVISGGVAVLSMLPFMLKIIWKII
jgi:hypothetical protein